MELVVDVYRTTAQLPEDERFGLSNQLRRAAVSVPSVLAEGHARGSTKEFMRYAGIAMGSIAEMETQLLICLKLELLNEASARPILEQCNEQNRILRGPKKSLTSRLRNSPSSLVPHTSPL